jgi:hypothetical protein
MRADVCKMLRPFEGVRTQIRMGESVYGVQTDLSAPLRVELECLGHVPLALRGKKNECVRVRMGLAMKIDTSQSRA